MLRLAGESGTDGLFSAQPMSSSLVPLDVGASVAFSGAGALSVSAVSEKSTTPSLTRVNVAVPSRPMVARKLPFVIVRPSADAVAGWLMAGGSGSKPCAAGCTALSP